VEQHVLVKTSYQCNPYRALAAPRALRHRSEQYFTTSQSRAHLRRQLKGSPQLWHILVGRSDLLRIFAIAPYPPDNPYHH